MIIRFTCSVAAIYSGDYYLFESETEGEGESESSTSSPRGSPEPSEGLGGEDSQKEEGMLL